MLNALVTGARKAPSWALMGELEGSSDRPSSVRPINETLMFENAWGLSAEQTATGGAHMRVNQRTTPIGRWQEYQ